MSRKTRKKAEKKRKRTAERLRGRTVTVTFEEPEIEDEEIEEEIEDEEVVEDKEVEKERGEGQGQGGDFQGDGGADMCECPDCGKQVKHGRGEPCTKMKCPDCGVEMTGVNSKEKAKTFTKKQFIKSIPILKADEEKRIVYGIVYAPGEIDSQGEYALAEDIERACHEFMKNFLEVNVEHKRHANPNLIPVENFIAPVDFEWDRMDGTKEVVTKGSWIMATKIEDDIVWSLIKSGEITGYSMEGEAMVAERVA